jgi:N-acetylated-alpha-linked acidic dipeptidase
LTSKPHIAGSARNTELAHNISSTWKSYGFDTVKMVRYNVLLSFPTANKTNGAFILDDKGNTSFETAKQEDIVDPSCDSPDASPPFSAYSPTGQATVSTTRYRNI